MISVSSQEDVASDSLSVFDTLTKEPFTTISREELNKIVEMTEIERATRIPLGKLFTRMMTVVEFHSEAAEIR